ncbi:MAG: hypothetical protein KKA99_06885 [Gammaproteobacteria bacterium]|nr:hypothetical protein [Gammaproteobacteria bacterium]
MKKRLKYVIVGGILFLASFWGGKGRVEAGSIAISPARVEKTITQDDHSFSITVSNPSTQAEDLIAYTLGMTQSPTGGAIFEEPGEEGPWSVSKLIRLEPTEFRLAPGESQEIKAEVEIQKDRSGGAYGVVIVSSRPQKASPGSGDLPGIEMGYQVGALVLLTFPGETPQGIIRSGKIKEIYIIQHRPGEEVGILTCFHNTGNIHLRPGGDVVIKDSRGRKIAEVPIEPGTTLPDCSRSLQAVWKPKDLPCGEYTAESRVEFSGGQLIVKETHFTVISPSVIAQSKGEIVDFSEPKATQKKPIQFRLLFCNKGNIDIHPQGKIKIREDCGEHHCPHHHRLVAEIPLGTQAIPTGSSQHLTSLYQEGLAAGQYIAEAMVDYAEGKKTSALVRFLVREKEIVLQGDITEFTVGKTRQREKIPILLLFRNTGNITSYVEGMIELKNSQGKTVGQMPIERRIVPHGETQRLETRWQGELPVGLYKATVTLILGGEKTICSETSFLVME